MSPKRNHTHLIDMASTIWKGHLTFGLISIPVKLTRASRAEKINFRQLHSEDHARVRRAYVREDPPPVSPPSLPEPNPAEEHNEPIRGAQVRSINDLRPRSAPAPAAERPKPPQPVAPQPAAEPPAPRKVEASEIVKGFEYERDQFVVVSKDELAKLLETASRDLEILEFVRLAEIDPIYFETSYYVLPDKAGERPYVLLREALRTSGFVALARLVMHKREHVAAIRPGPSGLVLHTMFYQEEVHREDEYRADSAQVVERELELAVKLVNSLASPFDPEKYKDRYKERLQELVAAKLEGEQTVAAPAKPSRAAAPDILAALQQSLELSRKPPASEPTKPTGRRKAQGGTSKR